MNTVYLLLIPAVALAMCAAAPADAGMMRWACSRYVNGDWKGQTYVYAENRQEAQRLAEKKYREELEMPFDRIVCR